MGNRLANKSTPPSSNNSTTTPVMQICNLQLRTSTGFGRVYKGWVDEKLIAPSKSGLGMVVAIRKLNRESMQGFQDCQKGSLETHLFRRSPGIEPISWDIRLKILIGAARGLLFLHTSEEKVIYRNIKASKILLDGDYNAKLSDFGLAKRRPSADEPYVGTGEYIATYGCAAPEYIATGHLCVKSDVHAFGVVLLEMLTGLRALDMKRPNGQQNLVDWLKPTLYNKRKLENIMDKTIEGQYSSKAALQASQLTLKCMESEPENRPSMKEVVDELEQIEAMKKKPKNSKNNNSSPYSQRHRSPRNHVYR